MSVLDAFLSTSSNARSTFGDDPPAYPALSTISGGKLTQTAGTERRNSTGPWAVDRDGVQRLRRCESFRLNYNKYCTFNGNEPKIVEEVVDDLDVRLRPEPDKVSIITDASFSFISLPGHREGAGRVIKFSIVPAPSRAPYLDG